MPRGRKPQSKAFKIVTGVHERRINDQEPIAPRGEPPCPDWIEDEAKARWAELAPALAKAGVLTLIDGDVLAAYCQSWCEYRQATRRLSAEGRVCSSASGHAMPHPMVAQQRAARDAVAKFAALLGLDPSSRSRLKVEPQAEDDPMDQLLNESRRHA